MYGIAACWFLLGSKGLTMIFVHTSISYLVARLKNPVLTWLTSLLLLSTLHLSSIEEVKVITIVIFVCVKISYFVKVWDFEKFRGTILTGCYSILRMFPL